MSGLKDALRLQKWIISCDKNTRNWETICNINEVESDEREYHGIIKALRRAGFHDVARMSIVLRYRKSQPELVGSLDNPNKAKNSADLKLLRWIEKEPMDWELICSRRKLPKSDFERIIISLQKDDIRTIPIVIITRDLDTVVSKLESSMDMIERLLNEE